MNILMFTNTFTPHVGGVARSVSAFVAEYRKAGHRVLVVAPQYEGAPNDEPDVIRIPALQNFNGSDFSVRIPVPGLLSARLADFRPDLIHSHHPFLLGDTAMRVAAGWNAPLVFTHHTMYEQYTHYVPGDSAAMARFVKRLATGYANLCDKVFAPSQSVAAVLRQRGVTVPIEIVPTGVDVQRFARGDGRAVREQLGIPVGAFVLGHVGRLAPEKNLGFLAEALARCARSDARFHVLVVGSGPSEHEIIQRFERQKVGDRLHLAGVRSGQDLVDAYHAMDLFAFASHSETQGMVLTEAMASGLPVVAIDAPGVREVVIDGVNGRLLRRASIGRFSRAVRSLAALSGADRVRVQAAALETASRFSMEQTAAKALRIYEGVVESKPRSKQTEDSVWEFALRRIEVQWELWSNLARSATGALTVPSVFRIPGLGAMLRGWRRLRRWISRSEWDIRLLRLPVSEDTATEPGLVMVQIDGLARTQFERALRTRQLPFLSRLIAREGYQPRSFYSGLPSSTPAVQGELFYGVKNAVPAFAFRDSKSGKIVRMVHPEPAIEVERRLSSQGQGLLEGGSAYCDIYTGGAAESHFCAPSLGWGKLLHDANPLGLLILGLWHIASALRTVGLAFLEFALSLVDFARGVVDGKGFRSELLFIPSRVAVSIVLRELVTIGATIDATRGLPIIHVNFLGYDEQSHRRGPNSQFAHWTLKGIDGCIRRIWQAARRSRRRDYQVWIYSDHGQETSLPYAQFAGRSIRAAVADVFHRPVSPTVRFEEIDQSGVQTQRSALLGGGRVQRVLRKTDTPAPTAEIGELAVAAAGPVGLVYPPQPLSPAEREVMAQRLVEEAKVPLVLTSGEGDAFWAFTARGRFQMPEQRAEVLGTDHPFLDEVARDLIQLCRHRDAGQLVLCGYRLGEMPISFPDEHGAHAGPGKEETHGFALLPPGVSLPHTRSDYLRPGDLRAAALHALGRSLLARRRRISRPRGKDVLRVMTYNVHSCVGVDGEISTARIARLIAQYEPDIVALQEVDVRRARTGEIDQAHRIARELEMEFHFHPTICLEEESYGDAVLSLHPLRLVRADRLPGLAERPFLEPRGAIWVEIDVNGQTVHVINTHLGLLRKERKAQILALFGANWLASDDRHHPLILCGDLNAVPRSHAYRRVTEHLRDVQLNVDEHRPRRTWLSRYPLRRIDHVFVSDDIEVVGVDVPATDLARKASDHLPLIADLRLAPKEGRTGSQRRAEVSSGMGAVEQT